MCVCVCVFAWACSLLLAWRNTLFLTGASTPPSVAFVILFLNNSSFFSVDVSASKHDWNGSTAHQRQHYLPMSPCSTDCLYTKAPEPSLSTKTTLVNCECLIETYINEDRDLSPPHSANNFLYLQLSVSLNSPFTLQTLLKHHSVLPSISFSLVRPSLHNRALRWSSTLLRSWASCPNSRWWKRQ